jgi:NDP-sugar pyrophosphorylase family protein
MKIVIPMSGLGERFKAAGYSLPKALIEIEGKSMIQHVIDMFPGDNRFIFICNENHLSNPAYDMRNKLRAASPAAEIVAIPEHKLGPVHAITHIFDQLDDREEVVVNYCDFTCYWDFNEFVTFARESDSEAVLPCYRGFHPHMLGKTNYAFMREQGLWATDIQEKRPFTDDRMQEFASSGTFYFASGDLLKRYFKRCIEQKLLVNDEFYVSMAVKAMIDDKHRVSIYELEHFMQWGTPEDVREYNQWSQVFRDLIKKPRPIEVSVDTLIMPMAGLGSRFAERGYDTPKPLIEVSGAPMALQAIKDLPNSTRKVFIMRQEMSGIADIQEVLSSEFPSSSLVTLPRPTEGQACTCMLGLEGVEDKDSILIGACDNGVIFDEGAYQRAISDPSADVVVFAKRGYAAALTNPKAYGWLKVEGDRVLGASVKTPLNDLHNDPIIIGSFFFRRAEIFRRAAEALFARNGRINGEFYVDSLINDAVELGFSVRFFEVDHYVCWGTPDELKTFEYWQSCFHKWDSHPYSLEQDTRIPARALAGLKAKLGAIAPRKPGAFPTETIKE